MGDAFGGGRPIEAIPSHCWQVYGIPLQSRLFLGTARYPSLEVLRAAVAASNAQVITVSLRRESASGAASGYFWNFLRDLPVRILPNTAGCHTVKEAVTTAQMARDLFATNWIKLEVIGDDFTLAPDPFALVEAAQILCSQGFCVFPYTTEDLVVCQKLLDAGCQVLMPWGAPIGSGRGIINPTALAALRHRFANIPLIIDAGIGRPSHAMQAMELGYDGILVNTAVACASNPVFMARAFAEAAQSGRLGFTAGLMTPRNFAVPSTPDIGLPFRQNQLKGAKREYGLE